MRREWIAPGAGGLALLLIPLVTLVTVLPVSIAGCTHIPAAGSASTVPLGRARSWGCGPS